jgi:AraC-like DNA-binding protein
MNAPYIAKGFVDVLIRHQQARDIHSPALERQLQQLSQETRVDAKRFSDALEQIHQLDPIPALGLRIGLMAKPENFGLVGYLLAACSTLKQALIRYGRFQTLVLSELEAVTIKQHQAISFRWQIHPSNNPHVYEFNVGVFISLYQHLIDQPVPPVSVALPIATPQDTHLYEALLGCPITFNASHLQVDIPAQLMLKTISSRDPFLRRLLDQQASTQLSAKNGTKDGDKTDDFFEFLERVQQEIHIAMKDGSPHAQTVAERMGIPLRSFYRKLSEQGYQYRALLADLREKQAKYYLTHTELTPSEIAILLGYSEQSAFIRAFKGWVGVTPGEFRLSPKPRRG